MSISKDTRTFDFPASVCFSQLLALLPLLQIRVQPHTSTPLVIESHNSETGEIRAKTEPPTPESGRPAVAYYRLKFNCEPLNEHSCGVHLEAATTGVTDVGLGQLTLRQILITLNLALTNKLPPGTVPIFFVAAPSYPPGSPQAQFAASLNEGFELSRRGLADQAMTQFDTAARLNPASAEVAFHRGILLMLLGNLEEAAQSFQAAAELDQYHVLARPYLDDASQQIQKRGQSRRVSALPTASIHDHSATKKPVPEKLPDPTPGDNIVPNAGQSQVNEDNLAAKTVKIESNRRLFLRGDGATVSEYQITRPVTTIGRHEESDVLLLNGRVSRRHAQLEIEGKEIVLTDLGSANGTFLNGRRLLPQERVTLATGDQLGVGDVEITYINPGTKTRPPSPNATRPHISAAEYAEAVRELGLPENQSPTNSQIEYQLHLLQDYWLARIADAPTPRLRQEAEEHLTAVQKAYQLLILR